VLSFPSDGDLSLYLHIPFCTTCCSYCAFYSEPINENTAFLNAYVDRLEQEILAVASRVERFATIFIGGGNPGSLSAEQLRRLLVAAKAGLSDEVTVEMNPETFSEAFFDVFSEGLVTRLSMGIQSMDDATLNRLGRNARRCDNLRGINLAQKAHEAYGIELSFDLMVCLPGQTVDDAISDLKEVLTLSEADHISLYCLTVEEGTELAEQVGLGTRTFYQGSGQSSAVCTSTTTKFQTSAATRRRADIIWCIGNWMITLDLAAAHPQRSGKEPYHATIPKYRICAIMHLHPSSPGTRKRLLIQTNKWRST